MIYTSKLTGRGISIKNVNKEEFAGYCAEVADAVLGDDFDGEGITDEEMQVYDRMIFGHILNYIIRKNVKVAKDDFKRGKKYVKNLLKANGLPFDDVSKDDLKTMVVCHYILPNEFEKADFVSHFIQSHKIEAMAQ